MPVAIVQRVIAAPACEVFALIHDYERRLCWDSLLSEAYLEAPATRAGVGAIAVCRGRKSLGGFALRTQYLSFRAPHIAAITLVEPAPFFTRFSASIRHAEITPYSSTITYRYSFTARPWWLCGLLEPLMNYILRRETERRLDALAQHFAG